MDNRDLAHSQPFPAVLRRRGKRINAGNARGRAKASLGRTSPARAPRAPASVIPKEAPRGTVLHSTSWRRLRNLPSASSAQVAAPQSRGYDRTAVPACFVVTGLAASHGKVDSSVGARLWSRRNAGAAPPSE